MPNSNFNGTVSARIFRQGNSSYLLIPKVAMNEARLNDGDLVVIRCAGEKLILERVPVEKLAVIRTGEIERAI